MIHTVFPSHIYRDKIAKSAHLNRELKREIGILSQIDEAGRRWSKKNYIGGYSSYASVTNLHHTSPHFEELAMELARHARRFARRLEWDLMDRKIEMTTCWANSMGLGTHHTMHLHPLSVLSGVYYVDVPPGSSVFKLEDPRMARMMAAPPRKADSRWQNRNYIEIPAKSGEFILFESWMKHEVPPHRARKPRLSISFNFEWI